MGAVRALAIVLSLTIAGAFSIEAAGQDAESAIYA